MKIKCLDHGFVTLLNIAGPLENVDITHVAKSARISFDNFEKDRTREQDYKLCQYLIQNQHNTPFEMIEVWLEMKLPIFVARQFVRHRTVSINEVSARYSTLPAEWYIPCVVGGKPVNNKQGQSNSLDPDKQMAYKLALHDQCEKSYNCYIEAIDSGAAPEHARLFLHVNHYTHWIWKQDLHNIMHFLSLRLHEHAQIEARVYAEAIYSVIKAKLPGAMELFDEYKRKS